MCRGALRLVATLIVWTAAARSAGAALPDGWSGVDIGACGLAGSSAETADRWTVRASGRDIWDAADAFHFVWRPLRGDGVITARVVRLENTSEWAKAGVMVRGSLAADAAFAMTIVTPTNGVHLQYRGQPAEACRQTEEEAGGPAPCWLRLARVGRTITSYCSTDGNEWTTVGETELPLGDEAYAGLCVTSHDDHLLSTAVFEWVSVTLPGEPMPARWRSADVGNVAPAGESARHAGSWTLVAAGADIWDPDDSFHFVHQPLSGDGEVVARVDSLDAVDAWSKCGVMVRESLDPAAAFVMTVVTGANGVRVQFRPSTGGACGDSLTGAGAGAPYWVKLRRKGNTFTGFCAKDGIDWVQVHQTDVQMPKDVLVGLCLTSHNAERATTARMSAVSVTPG